MLRTNASVSVPYGTFDAALLTKEFSRLDPSFVEHKYYVAGVGFVKSVAVRGGQETLELVHPP